MGKWIWRVVCASAVGASGMAMAQEGAAYPTRPVRMVIHIGPGSSMDIIGRVLGQKLSEAWGQSLIVDNRAGAGGTLGMDVVAKAPPDGHTILFASSSMAIASSFYKKLPFDTLRDFEPITQITSRYNALVVPVNSQLNSVKDVIALARSKPGLVSYGSGGGTGSSDHMAGELFALMTGAQLLHVPYKSGPQAVTDLIGGQLTIYMGGVPINLPMIKSGKLKPLGVSSPKRIAQLPDVPTIAEAGVPGFEVNVWYGLFAPRGTPQKIIAKISADVSRIVKMPEMRERFSGLGADSEGTSPAEFRNYFRADVEKWARVVKSAKLSSD
ncbi:MAG: tripartite tricarboxylate transporter substrate binding protein [Burkholderiales bacterium]